MAISKRPQKKAKKIIWYFPIFYYFMYIIKALGQQFIQCGVIFGKEEDDFQ